MTSKIQGAASGVIVTRMAFDGTDVTTGNLLFRPVTTAGEVSRSTVVSLSPDVAAQFRAEIDQALGRKAVILPTKAADIPYPVDATVQVEAFGEDGLPTRIEGGYHVFEGTDVHLLPAEVPTHPDTITLNNIKDLLS